MSAHELGAVDAARAIRRRELSPVDLVDALLARIDALDARVQAWALVDREGARAVARRAADEAMRGTLRGPRFQVPWSLSGLPSITIPCGLSASGLPLGIQLVSGMFTEPALLAAAAWCEHVLGPGVLGAGVRL